MNASANHDELIGWGGADLELDSAAMAAILDEAIEAWSGGASRVLLAGPDITRYHSGAGAIACQLYEKLSPFAHVDLIPALGSHDPMTREELALMYPSIPEDRVLVHNWRTETVRLGEIPAAAIVQLSEGKLSYSIDVRVNRHLVETPYDLIISIGQVVPHEVIGMANHIKNILVGLGGKDILDKTHYLGAVYGMERMMGRIDTPVRRVMDMAAERYLAALPLRYIQTVVGRGSGAELAMRGLFAGSGKRPFIEAARLAQKVNLDLLDRPIHKAVVWLPPGEFRSTWLGNKAIYRTRMAMADGGELIILAPSVRQFGEDMGIDALIRRHGYLGTPHTLDCVQASQELRENLSAAAHLIHGSSEGRFRITYAPGHLTREEIEGVGFEYAELEPLTRRYDPARLADGFNWVDGEEIFFVSNPGLGLWARRESFMP